MSGEALAAACRCPDTRAKLAALEADYDAQVAARRVTLLDLAERFPAAELGLDALVELSAPIAPRFYSIASSPLVEPAVADLIVGTALLDAAGMAADRTEAA